MTALCPLHPESAPRDADHGLMLCRRHADQLNADLRSLPRLHAELELAHHRSGGQSPRVSGTPEKRLIIDPAAADCRDDIARRLASWARVVVEERGLSLGLPGSSFTPSTATLGAFLARHSEWLAAQTYADEVAGEIRETTAEALRLARPSGRRRIRIGPCVEDVDGKRCAGQVATLVPGANEPWEDAVCNVCGKAWPPSMWLKLGAAYDQQVSA